MTTNFITRKSDRAKQKLGVFKYKHKNHLKNLPRFYEGGSIELGFLVTFRGRERRQVFLVRETRGKAWAGKLLRNRKWFHLPGNKLYVGKERSS